MSPNPCYDWIKLSKIYPSSGILELSHQRLGNKAANPFEYGFAFFIRRKQ